jgi:hypothetical protein
MLVLGMHRSGTSAVTRMLSLRGAALPIRMLAPQPDNETGFWEPSEITAIHDDLLESVGSSWSDIREFPSDWFTSESARHFKCRLLAALIEDYSDSPLFVVKDPRLCRLVPLWRSVLEEYGAAPIFIIPVRNPLEVAASLTKRNGYSEARSLLLWLRHFLAAERDTRGLTRSFVAYDRLLEDWHGVADRIARNLSVLWPRQSAATDIEIDGFLSPALRHYSFEPEDLYFRQDVAQWLKKAFNWALRAANDQVTTSGELDEIHAALETADKVFVPLVAANEERFSTLSRDMERLAAECSAREEENQLLRTEAKAQGDQVARLQKEVAGRAAQIASQGAEIDRLQSELTAHRDEVWRLYAEIAARDSEITAQDGELIRRNHRIRRLESEVAARAADIAALRKSLSWRLTLPVRAVGSRIKRLRAMIAAGWPRKTS